MDDEDPLGTHALDDLAAGFRGALSLFPFGGVIAELITRGIPNQRIDRVAAYIAGLEERLTALELSQREEALSDPEKIDLIEEGAFQSARATTRDRIERIAELVANGLAAESAEVLRRKRLALLLRQIDDEELAILNAYGQAYGGNKAAAWAKVVQPPPAHLQAPRSQVDDRKLYEAGPANLLRLGLLMKRYRRVPKGAQPVFDPAKGDFEHTLEVSYLGRLLLRAIGHPSPIDVERAEGQEANPST